MISLVLIHLRLEEEEFQGIIEEEILYIYKKEKKQKFTKNVARVLFI